MLFNSVIFLLFLPTVFLLYWSLQGRKLVMQNLLLIVASYIFYGWWDYRFLSLIIISSLVDYSIGLHLGRSGDAGRRRFLLMISMVVNLGILCVFKYFNFFVDSGAALLERLGLHANVPALRVILPVGISFYTFQTMSYTIDIYRRKLEPTRNIAAFFAFVAFFPQLVAGPIERATNLLPQFLRHRRFDEVRARDGLRQILWGFFKKVVIADTLAPHVETIFSGHAQLDAASLWIGVLFFAIQIYCDFSGYSDIAIGVARLFGFDLMRNFAYPYFSRDIGEFWRRWHISLSTWFRDYVYIPLGGSRSGKSRRMFNLILTFTISGLWHGASWTFVVWGLINGLYYIPLMLAGIQKNHTDNPGAGRMLPSLKEIMLIAVTFLQVLLAWVFFRSDSLRSAFGYLRGMAGSGGSGETPLNSYLPSMGLILILVIIEWLQRSKQHGLDIVALPGGLRWTVYTIIVATVLALGNNAEVQFIYFQF
ncbi:MAG: MBOAT family protein [bacterium]|nr:MBOAT family protein [bacterium]